MGSGRGHSCPGRVAGRAAGRGPPPDQGRRPAGGGAVARGAGLGGRGPLPAPRLPAPPRARSRPACSPATGTTPASTWPAAARSTRGPTTPAPSTSRSTATTCWSSARAAGEPVERLRRRLRDGLEQGLTLVTAKATLGLLEQPGGADEVVRTALDFGLANRATAGARASRCWWRWPTCCPTSTTTTVPWRSSTPSPSSPATRCGSPPRFPIERARRRRRAAPSAWRRGTAASSTPARSTPPSARWPPPWPPVRAGRPRPRRCSSRPPPTTSSSTRATRSTSPTRPSRRWPTSAPSRPRRCSPRSWPRRAGPTGPRSRRSGGTPSTWSRSSSGPTPLLLAAVDKGAGRTFSRRRHPRLGAAGGRSRGRRRGGPRGRRRRGHARAARPGRGLRGGAAHRPLPRPERPRRLGHGPPLLHHRQRPPPGAVRASRRPSCCGACSTGRCASTSTGS